MVSTRSFWLTLFIAATGFLLVIGFGALVGHALGLDEVAPSVGKNPFGVGISEGGGAITGITGWILAVQAQFSHAMTSALSLFKTNASAISTLLAFALAYGVFHAAGPGHGKAVVASYMLANERALRRGLCALQPKT